MDRRDLSALHAYAQEIARELGAPWRYDQTESQDREGQPWHYAALLTGLSDHGVNVRVDWQRSDRLQIRGRLPDKDHDGNIHHVWYEPRDGKHPTITVAIARGPLAAARAIQARLLPIYDPAYAKVRARVDKANEELAHFHRVRAMLAPFGRMGSGRAYSGASDGRMHLHCGGTARVSSYRDQVDLSISVSSDQAVEILGMLAGSSQPARAKGA